MKFKQNQTNDDVIVSNSVKMSDELYNGFIDIIQFEINKLALITASKHYFYINGLMQYKKFFKYLYKECEKIKCCFVSQLLNNVEEVPEFIIPKLVKTFENEKEPFEALAKLEDEFEEKLNALINTAFKDKDWKNFHYLLKKLDTIDHICCRALAAVEHKADLTLLCEQPIMEK